MMHVTDTEKGAAIKIFQQHGGAPRTEEALDLGILSEVSLLLGAWSAQQRVAYEEH